MESIFNIFLIGVKKMIDFEKELKQFKRILNIDHIEEQVGNDDMKDINDYIREMRDFYSHNSTETGRK